MLSAATAVLELHREALAGVRSPNARACRWPGADNNLGLWLPTMPDHIHQGRDGHPDAEVPHIVDVLRVDKDVRVVQKDKRLDGKRLGGWEERKVTWTSITVVAVVGDTSADKQRKNDAVEETKKPRHEEGERQDTKRTIARVILETNGPREHRKYTQQRN